MQRGAPCESLIVSQMSDSLDFRTQEAVVLLCEEPISNELAGGNNGRINVVFDWSPAGPLAISASLLTI